MKINDGFYNLDLMQFRPGPPATFLSEHTPQGAEWWEANRDTTEGEAIIKFMTAAAAELAAIHAAHMQQAPA